MLPADTGLTQPSGDGAHPFPEQKAKRNPERAGCPSGGWALVHEVSAPTDTAVKCIQQHSFALCE